MRIISSMKCWTSYGKPKSRNGFGGVWGFMPKDDDVAVLGV